MRDGVCGESKHKSFDEHQGDHESHARCDDKLSLARAAAAAAAAAAARQRIGDHSARQSDEAEPAAVDPMQHHTSLLDAAVLDRWRVADEGFH